MASSPRAQQMVKRGRSTNSPTKQKASKKPRTSSMREDLYQQIAMAAITKKPAERKVTKQVEVEEVEEPEPTWAELIIERVPPQRDMAPPSKYEASSRVRRAEHSKDKTVTIRTCSPPRAKANASWLQVDSDPAPPDPPARISFKMNNSTTSSTHNNTHYQTRISNYYPRTSSFEPVIRTQYQGFRNLGNTCYMNAVLQALLCNNPFIADLATNLKLLGTAISPSSFCASLYGVSERMQKVNHGVIDLRSLKAAVDRNVSNFIGWGQQDAHEFLGSCLTQIEEELELCKKKLMARHSGQARIEDARADKEEEEPRQKKGDEKRERKFVEKKEEGASAEEEPTAELTPNQIEFLSQVTCPTALNYGCVIRHEYRCIGCSRSSFVTEICRELCLDVPVPMRGHTPASIRSLLRSFFAEEVVDRECNACTHEQAVATHKFLHLPRILIVHLKRFEADRVENKVVKLKHPVIVDKQLCIDFACNKFTTNPQIPAKPDVPTQPTTPITTLDLSMDNPPQQSSNQMTPSRAPLPPKKQTTAALKTTATFKKPHTQPVRKTALLAKSPWSFTGDDESLETIIGSSSSEQAESPLSASLIEQSMRAFKEDKARRKEDADFEEACRQSMLLSASDVCKAKEEEEKEAMSVVDGVDLEEQRNAFTQFELAKLQQEQQHTQNRTAAPPVVLDLATTTTTTRSAVAKEEEHNKGDVVVHIVATEATAPEGGEETEQEAVMIEPREPAEPATMDYQLRAIVTHKGYGAGGGHYIADINTPLGTSKWASYDDALVTPVPEKEVLGSIRELNAYLLFYKHTLC
eukprot:TRINITY_DN14107_c0_g1_i1.p1 TRINITY_DN14107_c0_g1~~TRINITY_DN14107_c0_g1_i1.p1  ORF type:complete len:838 (+),score=162.79 TRINITY_DN14107_c0_g1_i1:91-2514(+)